MPLSVGDKLGPYEILSPIGAGGMGQVWKARDTRLKRLVAIKQLKKTHLGRFRQEARAIAALNHPHICQIYDVGPNYLVMEFIDGTQLHGPLPIEEVVRLGIQIADGLEYAHARGIFHRDLKPANIMVTDKNAKVLDFGLAKSAASTDTTQTIEGKVVGTPAYMSPEQAEGKPADARSDVFSFGAVLYEMLTGRRAFDEADSGLRDSVAARIVKRCLARDPSQRFQRMAEVRSALTRIAGSPAEQLPSIAVLPFSNLSEDKEQEYFSDGLAEEILNALAHMPGLKVTARTSSFAFRGKHENVTKIAETLHVRTVLEGSVRRAGSRIRVTAQLINAEDGYHLWSERYDREMTDVFAVQDEIAASIAGALQVKLTGKPAAARLHKPAVSAYEALLKGRHQITKFSPEGYARAKGYFEQAIALDPEYAEPHAELGRYFFYLAMWSLRPPGQVMPLARVEAQRALELSPSDPTAHAVLCFVAAMYDYDWKEAANQYELTRTADPVPPLARTRAAVSYLLPLGHFEQAIEEIETAIEQDPLNVTLYSSLATVLLFAGMYERTVAVARSALEIDEQHWELHLNVSLGYAFRGMFAEARGPAETAFRIAPWNATVIGSLAGILACLGEKNRAEELLAKIPESASSGRVAYHQLCSEIEACADWYEKDIESRQPMAAFRAASAFIERLRSGPRWPKLAKMMNLPKTEIFHNENPL